MAENCPFHSQHHGIPHWKFLLRCYDKCPGISITHHDTNKYATNTCSIIRFCVYRDVSRCTLCGIRPYKEQKICSICSTDLSYVTPGKVYTQKDILLLKTLIS